MKANIRLFIAIRAKGLRQRDFARLVEEHESVISRVVNGWWNLDEGRKAKYARALGCDVGDIFDD